MAPILLSTPFSRTICVLLVAFAPNWCHARNWVDVIDTTIYASALDDPSRSAYSFETLLPTVVEDELSLLPTPAPLASIIEAPTVLPSLDPTMSPSQPPKCLAGNDMLYDVQLLDSWGDGWSGTRLEISMDIQSIFSAKTSTKRSIYNSTLHDGASSESFVCLSPGTCYDIFVGGGKWEDEVKWSIREAFDETTIEGTIIPSTMVKGTAPMKCRFSIPSADGAPSACPVSCWVPTTSPTSAPTLSASDSPSAVPTRIVSDQPSTIPSPSTAEQAESSRATRAPSSSIGVKSGSTAFPYSPVLSSSSPVATNDLVRKPSIFLS